MMEGVNLMKRLVLALLCALFSTSTASAATWYVDAANSSGITDGQSWATAWTSIQAAIDAASAGDRIIVARGRYVENIQINGKAMVLQSLSPSEPAMVANTIIDGNGAGPVVTFSGQETSQCVLTGFTITNGRAPNGGGILGNRARATIARNIITGNTAHAASLPSSGAGGGVYACLGLIQNNRIENNSADGNGGGVALAHGTVEGNTISGNTAVYGAGLYNSDGLIQRNRVKGNRASELGGGLYGCRGLIQNNMVYENEAKYGAGLSTCDASIRNNTVVNNRAANGGGGLAYCSQRTTIINCIVWGNAPEMSAQLLDCADAMYSCIQWRKNLTNGNINLRPRFIDWRNGDFGLRDSSPCIDAGAAVVGLTDDLDGDGRGFDGFDGAAGDGSDFDIGADEFTGVKALMFTRTVPDWSYQPGNPVDVTVTLNDFESLADSRDFALMETLPQGWTFSGFVSAERPENADASGNAVTFTWGGASGMPVLPFTFTYRVDTASASQGPQTISGHGEYLVNGIPASTHVVSNSLLGPGGGALDEAYVDQIELQGEALGWSFEVGLTEAVTDIPVLTFAGFDASSVPESPSKGQRVIVPSKSLPAIFDWRDKNALTPVKYQDVCGSCWAFATNGVLEAAVKIHDAQTLDLSEQYLVSTNTHGWSCSGGSISFDYYIDRPTSCNRVGPVLESVFPYTGANTPPNCPYATLSQRLNTWDLVEGSDPSVAAAKQAIMDYGPIFASVYTEATFQAYKGGVYNYDPPTSEVNHAVVLVGWNDTIGSSGAWVMRNSWSTLWGDQGYMYIEYGVANIGRWSAFADYGSAQTTGSVYVVIEPATARSQGAQWRVDSQGWLNSGDTAVGLSEGAHTVSFSDVNGWDTPASQVVNVSASQTSNVQVLYQQSVGQTGSLQVTINPQGARDGGAQWRIDGGALHNSGETVPGVSTGQHVVSFTAVNGWTKPADATVSITLGATTTHTGTYEQNGAVSVTINPQAARDAGAQWQVDGGAWRNSGQTVSGLATGSHTVTFSAVANWSMPPAQAVTVEAGSVATAAGTYTQQVDGTLQVTINPTGACTAGARWRVDGGAWQVSGASLSLSAGAHVVSFNSVAGYTAPLNRNAWIDSAVTSSTTVEYAVLPTGASVHVVIEPAGARNAGAQWQLDGGVWRTSGQTVTGVAAGTHTVVFNSVTGWQKPGNWTFSSSGTGTSNYTGTYTALAEGEGEGDGEEGEDEGVDEGEDEGEGEEDICGCSKSGLTGGIKDYLGDMFLLGLSLGALVTMAGLRRR
jgi:parallel beta-helix repeat protein